MKQHLLGGLINSLYMQVDFIAWPSRQWENHFVTGTFRDIGSISQGFLLSSNSVKETT
jgi:hypothetical protein